MPRGCSSANASMAREPFLVVTDPRVDGLGGRFRQRRDDAPPGQKHDKTMNAIQVMPRKRYGASVASAMATVLPKAAKRPIANFTELDVIDREPSRKMARAISVTDNGQRCVP
jgi:hypothetical protein